MNILSKLKYPFFIAAGVMFFPSASFASCFVKDDAKTIVIGHFPFASAYYDCLRAYKNHYLRKDNDGDSELYLKCHGAPNMIASVQGGTFAESGVSIAGCVLPKTIG